MWLAEMNEPIASAAPRAAINPFRECRNEHPDSSRWDGEIVREERR